MARDRKRHAGKEGALSAVPPLAAAPSNAPLNAATQSQAYRREQMLALIRAMARDAARANHAACRPGAKH